jgi:opacity protein-like surface antigen
MTERRLLRNTRTAAAVLLSVGVLASPAMAQEGGTIEVTNVGVVMETARGDSVVLDTIEPGTVLEVLDFDSPWYEVRAPRGSEGWRRGWLHQRYIQVLTAPTSSAKSPTAPTLKLRTSIRGFGQFGAIRFTAADSFDAVTGNSWGPMWGGGAQMAFSNGLFFQGSYERYQSTGQRVFVVDSQVFELGIENEITVTPIQVTVGYRQATSDRVVGYVGGGVGWHRLEEVAQLSDPAENVDETEIGYHVLGGMEYAVTPWLWVGGEGQWAYVPDILGNDGVSAAFDEDDLGGFTLRFKLTVGL